MALHYDYTKCTPPKDSERPILDALIWATLFVGMNEITPKNAVRFYKRASFWEKVVNPYLQTVNDDGTTSPRPLTQDDVNRWIGLSTNATNKTDSQFLAGFKRDIN